MTIHPRRVSLVLLIIALVLAAQSFVGECITETFFHGTQITPVTFLNAFSVNNEESLPDWFSTLLLFGAAALFMLIAGQCKKGESSGPWWGLGIMFTYMSLDEGAALHELMTDPMNRMFHTSGFFTFGWVIVFAPLALVIAMIYLPFVLRCRPRTRVGMLISGALYIMGAVGLEMVGAKVWASRVGLSLPYLAIGTLEELLEMLGVIVLMDTLMHELRARGAGLRLDFLAPFKGLAPRRAGGLFGVVVAMLMFDFAMLAWGQDIRAHATQEARPSAVTPDTSRSARLMVDELVSEGTLAIYAKGVFGPDAEGVIRRVAPAINAYPKAVAIALPERDATLILAGDDLNVTQESLATAMDRLGVTKYLVYEGPTIRALLDSAGHP